MPILFITVDIFKHIPFPEPLVIHAFAGVRQGEVSKGNLDQRHAGFVFLEVVCCDKGR